MPISNSNKAPVSVLVCTKDEERNLKGCLEGVSWADDIIVLDSFSDDDTANIARQLGARVMQREFTNFSDHKNWALDNLGFAHDWLLMVDADERVSEVLAQEIAAAVDHPGEICGYYLARQNFFCGQWIRHGGWYPDYNLRLLKRGRGRYESRLVHEHVLLDGLAGYLKNPLIHHDFKGMERYFDRHNVYSSLEAVEARRTLMAQGPDQTLPALLWGKGPGRRRFLKNLAYRYLPARSLVKFLWMYVIKLGFLDGRLGFRYCLLHTFYEYQVSLKLEELQDPGSPITQKYRDLL
jgi:glycosyltransferase involved in cell wall biosynthesis